MGRFKKYFGLSAFIAIAALPLSAHANWLDLADGTYDVTLNCTTSTVLACPLQVNGTFTVSGTGVSSEHFIIDGQTFSGDPTDVTYTDSSLDFEYSQLIISPLSFLMLSNDLSLPNSHGLSDHWWEYCHNVGGIATCLPQTFGNWEAVLVSPAPEPITIALFSAGLAGLRLSRRKATK